MARKTKEEALKTRQLLIEAAITMFATRGVANTTLGDIADAAGVTRGAVYWHFSSKAEIFNAIWEQQPPLRAFIKDKVAVVAGSEPLLLLREIFIASLQFIARDARQCALLQILYHKCEFSADMMSECEIRKKIFFNSQNIQRILEEGVKALRLPSTLNIDIAMIMLHGFFSGIIKNWLMNRESFNLCQQAPVLVDNILATLQIQCEPPVMLEKAS